jgi:hypothetical protein
MTREKGTHMKTSTALFALLVCAALPLSARGSLTESGLRQDMRRLWSDHVIWTRGYIVAALGDDNSAPAAAERLLRNQEDIGNAIAPFYGEAAGRQLTVLLKEHITIAVDLVGAAKSGRTSDYEKADAAWQQNAIAIADFLSRANPHWPRAALVSMMKDHLSTTTTMVVARLNKDWKSDAAAFDKVYDHILHMSDALAAGIVQQFPNRFDTVPSSR